MLCKRCMVIMEPGTRYEQKKGENRFLHKRYFKCKKCGDRAYTNAFNFQEVLKKESEKNRNR